MVNGTRTQVSAAWQANSFNQSTNGAAVGTLDTSGTLPTMTTLRLGGAVTGANGHNKIRRIVYVPRRVADASLPTWRYNT
jgi:hypothetical protein